MNKNLAESVIPLFSLNTHTLFPFTAPKTIIMSLRTQINKNLNGLDQFETVLLCVAVWFTIQYINQLYKALYPYIGSRDAIWALCIRIVRMFPYYRDLIEA